MTYISTHSTSGRSLVKHAKAVCFVMMMLPLLLLVWCAIHDQLGANPVEYIIRDLGKWTLISLLITLGITPLHWLTGSAYPLQMRRLFGLFAFWYLCLHLVAYAGLDQWFDWGAIAGDIRKHPYVVIGFSAWVLMIPLAITSNRAMIRRLKRHWKSVHRTVYVIAILGVTHFYWLVKKDVREPLWYAAILAVLLGVRIVHFWQKRLPGDRTGALPGRTISVE